MWLRMIAAVFLGLVCFQVSNARILTFEEALSIALNQSYSIRAFEKEKQAAQFSYQYYKAQFKPRIDLGLQVPSWSEQVTPIQQADGLPVYNSTGSFQYATELAFTYMLPTGGNFQLSSDVYRDEQRTVLALQDNRVLQTDKMYTKLGLSFEQPIFTANRLKENLRMAQYQYEHHRSRFTREQVNIMYKVTEGFYELYRATRQVEIARRRYENAGDAYRVAQILEKNGRIPEVDVLITKVDMAEREAELSESINTLEREKDSFKHLIGIDLDLDIEIETHAQYDTPTVNMDKAIRSALKNRMELKEQDVIIKLHEIDVDQAHRTSEFSGRISAYYDFTGISTIDDPGTRKLLESSVNNFMDRDPNRGITISFSVPIFDWGRQSARVQEEKVQLDNSRLAYENQRNLIIGQVRDIVRSVKEARNRLRIHEQNKELSELTYSISRKRFENGDISSQELSIEQERLANSQMAYLDAYVTYQLALADLKRKTMWDFGEDRSYLRLIENMKERKKV